VRHARGQPANLVVPQSISRSFPAIDVSQQLGFNGREQLGFAGDARQRRDGYAESPLQFEFAQPPPQLRDRQKRFAIQPSQLNQRGGCSANTADLLVSELCGPKQVSPAMGIGNYARVKIFSRYTAPPESGRERGLRLCGALRLLFLPRPFSL
jgi:hypothetical protein